MQNNEFEKQVQERMGQVKFTPSETVWNEVEKSLKQRRKRRVAILWLFIFFIAAGGSSLGWFYLSPGNTDIAKHDISSLEKENIKKPAPVVNAPDQTPASTADKNVNPGSNEIPKTDQSVNNDDNATKQTSGARSALIQNSIASAPLMPKQKNKNSSSAASLTGETFDLTVNKDKGKKSSADGIAGAVIGSTVAAGEIGNKSNIKGDESVQAMPTNDEAITADSSITQKDSATSLAKTTPTIDSLTTAKVSPVKINSNTRSKWLFGVNMGFGMSDVVSPVSGSKSMDMASAPSQPNFSAPGSSAQSPGAQSPGLFIYPSELNPGVNFSIGVEATRKIKKRMSLNVGLQYHYYSTSIVVGRYLDSLSYMNNSSSFLAAGPRVNNHRNKYHFAELPVTLGFQVLKNKPLQLNAGLSLGYLFASDVLSYNKSQGVYYSDKNNLNKTQLHVLLGLSWTFGEKSRLPIQVGPNFSYGASNLSGKSVAGSNHMYTIGAGAKIMFRKK